MSISRKSNYSLPFIQAATGAAEAAASAALGTEILNTAHGTHTSSNQAAAAGAVGGAILGFANGTLEAIGLFRRQMPREATWRDRLSTPFSTIGFNTLATMTGAAILNATQDLSWETAAIVAVVGAAILYVPKMAMGEVYHQHIAPKKEVGNHEGLLGDITAEPTYHRLSPS